MTGGVFTSDTDSMDFWVFFAMSELVPFRVGSFTKEKPYLYLFTKDVSETLQRCVSIQCII